MEKDYFEDIICARATPPGASAIAVLRVSGRESWQLLQEIFQPAGKGEQTFQSHRVYYGSIIDRERDEILDKVVVLPFREGSGFTGEESFEVNCHGSEVVISLIIRLFCSKGARLAEPGEFSKRAFLNGKITLSEAEAIMDIVHSSTRRSALIAVRQLSGRLGREIDKIKEPVADLLAEIEVYIDYPEEDLSLDNSRWLGITAGIKESLLELLAGFRRGRFLREGVMAVILGKTNSGKSTLFNYLLNEDKAIVSDIHGTTRDYIDAVINIHGYGIRVYDTAGLRETDDPIEREGTRRARELSDKSDLLIYMIAAERGLLEEDLDNLKSLSPEQRVIVIVNKIDSSPDEGASIVESLEATLSSRLNYRICRMSALHKKGLDSFNNSFLELFIDRAQADNDDPLITNERHAALLEEALRTIEGCEQRLEEQILDLAAFELRESLDRLGEITGEITPEDIIQRIFSSFCVGK